jgi:parallel beta-helix repeat protein
LPQVRAEDFRVRSKRGVNLAMFTGMRPWKWRPHPLCWLAIIVVAGACGDDDTKAPATDANACTLQVAPSGDDQSRVQGALRDAHEGDVICFGAGTFQFTSQLGSSASNVTLRGVDGTVFDFSGQTSGANAVELTGDRNTLESLKIIDPKVDAVRASEVNGVTFRQLHVEWTRGPDSQNGGHGIDAVNSTHVLIEDCFTSGARDAGVFVAESSKVIIRRNEATLNVAGIEIENSTDVEAYENDCHDNTAGMLVSDVPGMRVQGGKNADVHDNRLDHNNQENFSEAGSILHGAAVGTGLLILAADDSQIHANHISDNHSYGVAVLSWYAVQRDDEGRADPKYDFYPEGNYVFDNDLSNNGEEPEGSAAMIAASVGETTIANVVWDGIVDWKKYYRDGVPPDPDPGWIPIPNRNCFQPGSASYMNLDLEHNGTDKSASPGDFECEQPSLPAIQL